MPILLQCSSFGSFQRAVPRLRAPWGERPAGHPEEHRSDAGQAQPGGNSCCHGPWGAGRLLSVSARLQAASANTKSKCTQCRAACSSFRLLLHPSPGKYNIDGAPVLAASNSLAGGIVFTPRSSGGQAWQWSSVAGSQVIGFPGLISYILGPQNKRCCGEG